MLDSLVCLRVEQVKGIPARFIVLRGREQRVYEMRGKFHRVELFVLG